MSQKTLNKQEYISGVLSSDRKTVSVSLAGEIMNLLHILMRRTLFYRIKGIEEVAEQDYPVYMEVTILLISVKRLLRRNAGIKSFEMTKKQIEDITWVFSTMHEWLDHQISQPSKLLGSLLSQQKAQLETLSEFMNEMLCEMR